MENKELKKNLMIIGMSILFVILFPYLKPEKFAISDTDFILDGPVTLLSSSVVNRTVTFSWVQDINYTMNDLAIFYTVGNSTTTSSSIPNPEGTNTINKFQIAIQPDNVTAVLTKWHTIYTKEVQVVNATLTSSQLCAGLGGTYSNNTCTCPDKSTWTDSSSTKVCPPIIKTVEKEVKIQPTFFEKFGLSIITGVILGGVIIFLLNLGRKK